MRPALFSLAIAVSTFAWIFQPIPLAGEKPSAPGKLQAAFTTSDWHWLLASPTLDEHDRAILLVLVPYLDPETFRSLEPRQREFLLRYADNRIAGIAPLARCWAPGTPENLLFAYHAVEEAAMATAVLAPRKANQFFRRWGRTATDGPFQDVQGRSITLTWSIVPDGTPIPGDPTIGDRDDPSNLRARLADIYGGDTGKPEEQSWFPIFRTVFDNITAQTGIKYVYEENDDGQTLGSGARGMRGVRGDIRLGGHAIDGDGSTLAYTFFPDNGDTVIDTEDEWFENTQNNSIRLANTIEHEHGHGIGLQHVCPTDNTKLMEPFINTGFRGMQFDDIYTLQRWYGDPHEQRDGARNNDSFDNATPLEIQASSKWQSEWLSIDGGEDVDYFELQIAAGAEVTARVTPSSGSYLEGSQNSNGNCSSGTPFEHSSLQDLGLELIGPDRATVLASASVNPAGQPEKIIGFATFENGPHYLRVKGDSTDLAQLYRLEVEVAAPAVAIGILGYAIVRESFSPPNGTIEPGETVELEVTLINTGSLDATRLQATLAGPAAFTGFEPIQDFGTLSPFGSLSRRFVFGLNESCGAEIPLDLTVTADGAYQASLPVRLRMGTISTLLQESFDGGGESMPAGWTSSQSGAGSGWELSTARADSPPSSAFAADIDNEGTSSLISPSLTFGASGGTLSFRHFFDTEVRFSEAFDGGVLEISLDGGPWQDILAVGATFSEGPYNRTLESGFSNPLPNRRAWAGDSDGWITTVVDLPSSLGGQPLRFRWRLGHDRSVAEEGWYLDDVLLESVECADTAPLVTLSVEDDTASEFSPLDRARLVISSELPPISDLSIPLTNRGTASASLDVTGLDAIFLPAGQTSVEVEIEGVNDAEVEGEETLVLSIDPTARLVSGDSVTITISDTPYGQWAATTLGLGTSNGPLQDLDFDRSPNLEEYAWQTAAASPDSFPDLAPRREGDFFRIDAPLGTLPPDVSVHAESSADLQNWTPAGMEALADGFRVAMGDPERYLRLVYRLFPAAP